MAHSHGLNLCIKDDLLDNLRLLVIPYDYFRFRPLGVFATADQGHYVLLIEQFNHSYAAVQLSSQMQLRWIALIYLEASLCTYGNAALILVEAEECDLVIAIRPCLLRTLCIICTLSHVIAGTVR